MEYYSKNDIEKCFVNSFDVFDTLLARKVLRPTDIFSIVEETYNIPNFKERRCIAQNNSNGTIENIYQKYGEIYNIDPYICKEIKELEIDTEIKFSYLIHTNCNRVKDGDILISDMYLSENDIMRILRAHGFNKNVKLYVTPNGKGSGYIWKNLKEQYNINLHLGDNEYSDIKMALENNVNAELTTIHKPNETEMFFINKDYEQAGFLLREFRHNNPYEINSLEYELYNDQVCFNIPLLILCSNFLYNILIKEHRNTLLLLTRDGCLLKHIFPILYQDIICKELHSSRIVHKNPNEEYKNYLKSIYNKDTCLLFDLYGGFQSGRELYKELFGMYPRVHLLGYNDYFKGSEIYEGLTYNSLKCFETFNVDTIGCLQKLKDGIFVRSPVLEYKVYDAQIYKNVIIDFCKLLFQNIDIFNKLPVNLLNDFITNIDRTNNVRNLKNNLGTLQIWNHPSLTDIANYLKIDKGSLKPNGHSYTEYYEVLLYKWFNKDCSILEIGSGRYPITSNNLPPSLELWKLYLGENVKIFGYDSNMEYKKFNNPPVHIYVGNQTVEEDILQCTKNMYDIIIDDGDHDSKGQQTMLKNLWSSLKPGGIYCIESLHWQPYPELCEKTKTVLLNWKNGIIKGSEFISEKQSKEINESIEIIEFKPTLCSQWKDVSEDAFCAIRKKL